MCCMSPTSMSHLPRIINIYLWHFLACFMLYPSCSIYTPLIGLPCFINHPSIHPQYSPAAATLTISPSSQLASFANDDRRLACS